MIMEFELCVTYVKTGSMGAESENQNTHAKLNSLSRNLI